MTEPEVTAIVLAGGRSSRFGRDKLAELIDGRSLLSHAIEAAQSIAGDVLVMAAPDAALHVSAEVRVIHDRVAFEGPLAGLLTGLDAATAPVVIVLAGDMPHVLPGVVGLLVRSLDTPGTEAAVLVQAGRPRPLPMALWRAPARAVASRLVDAGERRLRALPQALVTTAIPEAIWRVLDPAGRTMRDVDTPEDLP